MAEASLGHQFESSPNALNALRLLLAFEVVAWHAHSLRGGDLPAPLRYFVSDIGVDGFFAISGFLICRAWSRRPHVTAFLFARARRLLPGLWVCLIVTAFVIAPVACLVAGQSVPTPAESAGYALSNAGIRVQSWGIGGSPAGLADPGWNGSLWSLSWEVYCYLAVAALGLIGLLRGRCVLSLVALAWSFCFLLEAAGIRATYGPEILWMPQRASLMFGLGALLWCYRAKVEIRGRYALFATVAVALSVLLLENYRVVGGGAVAYLCVFGAMRLGRVRRLRVSNDLSYGVYIYAFPLQQALLLAGAGSIGWAPFFATSVAVTLPFAYLSWRLVERPLLGRRSQRAAAATQRSSVDFAAPVSTAWPARSMPTDRASATGVPGAS